MKKLHKQKPQSYLQRTVISWVEGLGCTALSLLAGILLFPLSFANLLLVIFLSIFVLVELRKIHLRRRKKLRIWPHATFTITGVILAFVLLTVSPFLGFSTTYVAVPPNKKSVFKASISTFDVFGKKLNIKLAILTDPIRPYIARCLGRAKLFNVKVIAIQKVGDIFFVVPPLETCYTHIESTSSPTKLRVSQLLHFFNICPTVDFSKVDKQKNPDVSFGWRLNIARSLSNTHYIGVSSPLWQAIDCGQQVEDEEFQYAALLDYALTAASVGKMEEALSALFAGGSVVPSRVESVRLTTLLAHWSRYCFGGTFGELQSLSYYREAVAALQDSIDKRDFEHSEHNQHLLKWADRKLLNRIGRDEKFFADELEKLGWWIERREHLSFEVLEPNDLEFAFELYKKTASALVNRGFYGPYIARLLKMNTKDFYTESVRASRNSEIARLFFETSLMRLLTTFSHSKGEREVFFDSFERAADATPSKWRPRYQEIFRKAKSLFLFRINAEEDIPLTPKELRILNLQKLANLWELLKKDPDYCPSIPRPPKTAWWTCEYIDWFMYTFFVTLYCSDENNVQRPVNRIDIRLLTRDNGGQGRLFLPGLALAVLVTRRAGAHELELLFEREFNEAVGKSVDEYFRDPVRTK